MSDEIEYTVYGDENDLAVSFPNIPNELSDPHGSEWDTYSGLVTLYNDESETLYVFVRKNTDGTYSWEFGEFLRRDGWISKGVERSLGGAMKAAYHTVCRENGRRLVVEN